MNIKNGIWIVDQYDVRYGRERNIYVNGKYMRLLMLKLNNGSVLLQLNNKQWYMTDRHDFASLAIESLNPDIHINLSEYHAITVVGKFDSRDCYKEYLIPNKYSGLPLND